jgi:long-chain acyl-CoA synthetase
MADHKSGIMPLHAVEKPPYTVEVANYEKIPGETIPRRHRDAKDALIDSPAEGVHTVYDIIQRSARLYPNHNAVGSRKLIKLHKETKKVQKNVDGEVREVDKEWQFFELGPYNYLTYSQYLERVHHLGSGLRKLGMNPEKKLHLYATTRFVLSRNTASAYPSPHPLLLFHFASHRPQLLTPRRFRGH